MRALTSTSAVVLLAAMLAGCGDDKTPVAPARAPVATIQLSPGSPFVVVSDTFALSATALDATGDTLKGRKVQWTSSDEATATVSSTGVVSGKAFGSVEITATIDAKSAKTTVAVVAMSPETQIKDFFWSFTWVGNVRSSPIPTQLYDVSQCPEVPLAPCLDDAINVHRVQWNDIWDWQPVAAWAAKHPGHLYAVGDDLNAGSYGGIYVNDPMGYAVDYCTFVKNVQKADPSAEFTPTMIHDFAMINFPFDGDKWIGDLANRILSEYKGGKCGQNPVSEWTFNIYGRWSLGLSPFTDYLAKYSTWAMSLPAPIGKQLVVGAWVLGGGRGDDIANDHPAYVARMREAKAWLFADRNIKFTRYLLYEPWPVENSDPHPLTDGKNNLNATGRALAEVTGRIAGPAAVKSNVSCMWTAETTGGPAPYSYEWQVNDVTVSRRHWLVTARQSGAYVLKLKVTDAVGGYSFATMNVSVSASAPSCTH